LLIALLLYELEFASAAEEDLLLEKNSRNRNLSLS